MVVQRADSKVGWTWPRCRSTWGGGGRGHLMFRGGAAALNAGETSS